MIAITIVRQNGVNVYIDSDDEHACVGSGITDADAFTDAIRNLEEAIAMLQTRLSDTNL